MSYRAEVEKKEVKSLNDVNLFLELIGCEKVSRDSLSAVFKKHGRDLVLQSINGVINAPNATDEKVFVERVRFFFNSTLPAQNNPQVAEQTKETDQSPTESEIETVKTGEYFSIHAYARGKSALTFNRDQTKNAFPTVRIEAASAAGNNFDWKNKTSIQLTQAELPQVFAVLIGVKEACEFKNHGEAKNKGFSMERQENKIFVKVFEANKRLMAVPVSSADLFYITSLFAGQILLAAKMAAPEITIKDVITLTQLTQKIN